MSATKRRRGSGSGSIVDRSTPGRPSFAIVVDLGLRPARRCLACNTRVWVEPVQGDECPKKGCTGALGPVKEERRQEWTSGFATKRDAQTALNDTLSAIDKGHHQARSAMTFAEFIEKTWLPFVEARKKPATAIGYRKHWNLHLRPHLGDVALQDITPSMLDSLYTLLLTTPGVRKKTPLSPASVRRIHASIHAALNYAVKTNLIAANPASKATPPTSKDARAKEMTAWSPQELRTFLDAVRDDRYAGLYEFALSTGMRRGEIVALRWGDVDLDARRVHVNQSATVIAKDTIVYDKPKSDEPRTIVLSDRDVTNLKAHRKRQIAERLKAGPCWHDSGYVFAREDGRPMHPDTLTQAFSRRVSGLRRAGVDISPAHFHTLRHTCATTLLNAGVPIQVVQKRLGHASATITMQVYAHALKDGQEAAATAMQEVLAR